MAGKIAQLKHLANYDDPECWRNDDEKIDKLLSEMKPVNTASEKLALSTRSKQMIDLHWSLVEGLAKLLLNAPVSSMTQKEFSTGWFGRFMKLQKYIASEEICEFFAQVGIACTISR